MPYIIVVDIFALFLDLFTKAVSHENQWKYFVAANGLLHMINEINLYWSETVYI